MTVPLPGPLHTHQAKLAELADMGYTDIWSAESDGADLQHVRRDAELVERLTQRMKELDTAIDAEIRPVWSKP